MLCASDSRSTPASPTIPTRARPRWISGTTTSPSALSASGAYSSRNPHKSAEPGRQRLAAVERAHPLLVAVAGRQPIVLVEEAEEAERVLAHDRLARRS